jgi:shikimate kinase
MTTSSKNIYLIGPRACGKTTLAKRLAEKLGRSVIDTDDILAERMGESIAHYVDRKGWEGFRDLEAQVLADVSQETGMVVACGGGIVLRPENREILKETGLVLYLDAHPDELCRRLAADAKEEQRPSLTEKSLEDEVREVLAEREPLYRDCATAVVPAGGELEETLKQSVDACTLLEEGDAS